MMSKNRWICWETYKASVGLMIYPRKSKKMKMLGWKWLSKIKKMQWKICFKKEQMRKKDPIWKERLNLFLKKLRKKEQVLHQTKRLRSPLGQKNLQIKKKYSFIKCCNK